MRTGPSPFQPSTPSHQQEASAELENLDQVVFKNDQHLIIWNMDQEAMPRVADAVLAWCRQQAPSVAFHNFLGLERLALLGHINQGIRQLGLTQAMQTPTHPGWPQQVIIIQHAEQLPASDVQMLQDLTRHLPGLCWRWVLLCNKSPNEQHSASLASIPASKPDSMWTAAESAAAPVELAAQTEPFWDPNEPVEPTETAVAAETTGHDQKPPLTPMAPTPVPAAATFSGSSSHPWAWLGLATLIILGAWGAWLRFGSTPSAPFLAAERIQPAAASSEPAAAITGAGTPTAGSALEAPTPSSTPASPPSATANDIATPTPTPAPAPAVDPITEVPDIALRGVRWLAQQSPELYVLEHGAFQTASQAQSLVRSREELVNARVLMRKNSNPEGRFLVITGPFRSQERAQNYKVRENLPPQIPVRRVSEVLQESVKAAPQRP